MALTDIPPLERAHFRPNESIDGILPRNNAPVEGVVFIHPETTRLLDTLSPEQEADQYITLVDMVHQYSKPKPKDESEGKGLGLYDAVRTTAVTLGQVIRGESTTEQLDKAQEELDTVQRAVGRKAIGSFYEYRLSQTETGSAQREAVIDDEAERAFVDALLRSSPAGGIKATELLKLTALRMTERPKVMAAYKDMRGNIKIRNQTLEIMDGLIATHDAQLAPSQITPAASTELAVIPENTVETAQVSLAILKEAMGFTEIPLKPQVEILVDTIIGNGEMEDIETGVNLVTESIQSLAYCIQQFRTSGEDTRELELLEQSLARMLAILQTGDIGFAIDLKSALMAQFDSELLPTHTKEALKVEVEEGVVMKELLSNPNPVYTMFTGLLSMAQTSSEAKIESLNTALKDLDARGALTPVQFERRQTIEQQLSQLIQPDRWGSRILLDKLDDVTEHFERAKISADQQKAIWGRDTYTPEQIERLDILSATADAASEFIAIYGHADETKSPHDLLEGYVRTHLFVRTYFFKHPEAASNGANADQSTIDFMTGTMNFMRMYDTIKHQFPDIRIPDIEEIVDNFLAAPEEQRFAAGPNHNKLAAIMHERLHRHKEDTRKLTQVLQPVLERTLGIQRLVPNQGMTDKALQRKRAVEGTEVIA